MERSEARRGHGALTGILAAALVLLLAGPVLAQQMGQQQFDQQQQVQQFNQQLIEPEEYEFEPGEGLHEEEWYDPSDWFDVSESVNFESDDWWDFGYGYDESYAGTGYGYGEGYGYGQDEFYGVSPAFEEEGIGTNDYYTEEWYQDEGIFQEW